MSRSKFKTRRTKDPDQDPHRQDVRSPTSWQHLRPVPHKRDPPEKSPPRTRSLRLARQVSAMHDLPPALAGMWAMTRGASTTTNTHGGTIPRAMQVHQLAAMQAADPDKRLNAGLTGCAAIPSLSSPALPHASSGLDLGPSVTG
jgi:hypothetical protein